MVDNHFSLLDIKLCFSILLVRNAKLVSFFFVRNYYLSTKTKIQCENKSLYFPYTYIGFSAIFALIFLIFLVRFNDFYNKKSPNNMPKLLYLSHILNFSKIFSKKFNFFIKSIYFKGLFHPYNSHRLMYSFVNVILLNSPWGNFQTNPF